MKHLHDKITGYISGVLSFDILRSCISEGVLKLFSCIFACINTHKLLV